MTAVDPIEAYEWACKACDHMFQDEFHDIGDVFFCLRYREFYEPGDEFIMCQDCMASAMEDAAEVFTDADRMWSE